MFAPGFTRSRLIRFIALIVALFVGFVLLSSSARAEPNAQAITVSGKVTDQSGIPIADVIVEIIDPATGSTTASATTGSDGVYVVLVDAGTYDVKVTPPESSGFQITTVSNQSLAGNTTLSLSSPIEAQSIFQLSGKITNEAGTPISGVSVDVIDPLSGNIVVSTISDTNGDYAAEIAGGTYTLEVTPPAGSGYQTTHVENQEILEDTVIDFALIPVQTPVTLSGRVFDPLGNGLPSQQIILSGEEGTYTASTDASGAYSIEINRC